MTQFVECQACRHTISAGDRHCSHCGAEVRVVAQESPAPNADTTALLEVLQRATLGEYEIREELGRGGMAVVYLAHEIRFGRKVALKVLAPHLQLLQGMPARFLREAQTAANLEHPNIIPIYAYRESSDFAFFTMRFVAGAPLSAIAREIGGLPVPVVRALLADIGSALSFAHQHGVMHRDVKPGNVLIGRDGSVIVTDFGIAKQAEVPGLTLTGQLLGTPRYMSPEQCRGHEITPASDQYSLGTMAYELLAGRPPFVGANAMDIMAQQMLDPVPDLRSFRPDCPVELADALTRMLAKQPHERFSSIDEALRAAQAMPVLPNDPVRLQLRRWVESPVHERTYAITPISPSPRKPEAKDSVRTPPSTPSVRDDPAPQAPITAPRGGPSVGAASSGREASAPAPRTAPADEDAARSVAPDDETLRTSPPSSVRRRWTSRAIAGGVAVVALLLLARWGTRSSETDEPPPPPPLPSTLVVSGLPDGGTMEVDGQLVSGPRVEIPAGAHALRLTAPGYVSMDTVVQLVAGTSQTIAFTATPSEPQPQVLGTLVLSRLPAEGTVRIDGVRTSGTRFELPAGRHTIRVEASGYTSFERTVNIVGGERQTLIFAGQRIAANEPPKPPEPIRARGVLLLRVRPFAKIFVDGSLAAEDAMLVRTLSVGTHRLRFEKDGYLTRDSTVEITEGDTLKVAIVLEPRP